MRARTPIDTYFDPAATPTAILQAVRALAAVSQGEVTQPDAELDCPAGILSERLFGPARAYRCRCRTYEGAEHAGTRCEMCDVEVADPGVRDARWAHVALAEPVLHPRLVPRIAALCGLSTDDVRRLHASEARLEADVVVDAVEWGAGAVTGPAALRTRLEAARDPELEAAGFGPLDLLVDRVPVIPPGDRPRIVMPNPSGDRWFAMAGGVRLAADNQAYLRLVAHSTKLARLVELAAPDVIVATQLRDVQQAFDELVHVLGRPAGDPIRCAVRASEWTMPSPEEAPPALLLVPPPNELSDAFHAPGVTDTAEPIACGWLDERRVLIRLPYMMFAIDVATGAITGSWRSGPFDLVGIHRGRALFSCRGAQHYLDPDLGGMLGLAVFDPDEGWLANVPDDMPVVVVQNNEPEAAWLCDLRTGAMTGVDQDRSGDRPHEVARTPDHAFIWVSSAWDDGAVHETATGVCWLKVSAMDLGRYQERWLADEPPPEGDRVEWQETRPAFVRANGRWRILDSQGSVSHDGEQLFRIGREIRAAAFDESGDRLVIVGRESLSVIDVPGARYLTQLDLRDYLQTFHTPEIEGLDDEQRDLLLVAFGTLRAALDATGDELAAVGIDDDAIAAVRAAATR